MPGGSLQGRGGGGGGGGGSLLQGRCREATARPGGCLAPVVSEKVGEVGGHQAAGESKVLGEVDKSDRS